jgi:hypothetical protein
MRCAALWMLLALAPADAAQFETRAGFLVAGTTPYSVAIGDFNSDGALDAAVVNDHSPSSVVILLGNGDGTFRQGATYQVNVVFSVAAASLRQNGILDLVVGGGNDTVSVLLGNGDGTFQPPVAYPTTAGSVRVGVGNFMGNGSVDIIDLEATSDQGEVCDCVEILPGNGDGTFGAPITTPIPYNIGGSAMVTGDFNNDGKLDVAVAGQFLSDYQVDILLGNGNGTFDADGYYALPGGPDSVAANYFTANKKDLDLALTDGSASVLIGEGNGAFQPAVDYRANFPTCVIAQDLNGDGKVDLAASDAGSPPQQPVGVNVLNGNGDGTFQPAVFYPAGKQINFVAAADFNGDDKPDLLLVDILGHTVITLLNTGVVSFSPTAPLNFGDQRVGSTSKAQIITLTNTGRAELKVKSMKASAEFGLTSSCGSTVAAGANCTISATFSPTKKAAALGTISIIDNASSKPQVIELLGTGT